MSMRRNVRVASRRAPVPSQLITNFFPTQTAIQGAISSAAQSSINAAIAAALPSASPTASFELTSRNERYNRREFNMTGANIQESASSMLRRMPADEMVRFHFYRHDAQGQRHDWGTKLMTAQEHLEQIDEIDIYVGDSLSGGQAVGGGASASGGGGGGGEEESPWVQQMSNKALYRIKNDDDLCGQRCLVIADMTESNRKTMHKRPESFTKKAKLLAKKLSVTGRMNHTDFDKYAAMFKRQVVIFMSKRDVAYSTPLEMSVLRDGTQAEPVFICWDSE